MKKHQNKNPQLLNHVFGLVLALSFVLPFSAKAAPLDFATIPLANSPTVPIKPNLLFVLDDSGSMGWSYMPDWAAGAADSLDRDASYNTISYDPSIRYLPPVFFDTSGLNTTKYLSQTGNSTNEGAGSGTMPNWKKVKTDPYLSSTTADITTDAYYYRIQPGEYCTRADLKVCNAQSAPDATYPFPASIRWCNTTTNANSLTPATGSCQGVRATGFTKLRAPAQVTSSFNFTANPSSAVVSGITVNGKQIMSSNTGAATSSKSTLANSIVTAINNCTYTKTGNCQIVGYSASSSGGTNPTITITAPAPTSSAPVISTSSGSISTSALAAFAKPSSGPGDKYFVVVTSTVNSYPLPGASVKSSDRADCAGTTCTYNEEMTNYANWYAYYSTRIKMMKTASSIAFKTVGDDFKVGLVTIHNASTKQDIKPFNTAQKAEWYKQLFNVTTGSATPLRTALSTAGRIYAHKDLTVGFADPIEYECQKNFTLLTTDGFWNTGDGYEIDGTTVMGNYDAAPTTRPYYEGSTATSNTLADVARYYYTTDLRQSATEPLHLNNCTGALGTNVCETPTASGTPPNKNQVMVTFTMGLGVDGTLAYTADYATAKSGDYYDIVNGTKNWTIPAADSATAIDDLWHAAVNAGGKYFSARNPNDVVNQLQDALAALTIKVGAGAAAATSTLNPISGDNYAYVASYTSGYWIGNLERRTINPDTGAVSSVTLPNNCVEDVVDNVTCASPGTIQKIGATYYCVTPGLTDPACSGGGGTVNGSDCQVPVTASCIGNLKNRVSDFANTRNIKMNVAGVLQDFTYTNLSAAQKVTFDQTWLKANLTQWPTLTADQQANVTGPHLVSYLRGETGYEQDASHADNQVFRKRQATLGDLVNSKPAFLGKPTFNYSDPGYQDFKTANASRAKTVFVGSNDGMLHAFDADTMEERWAYIPTMVIPNMWKLADSAYGNKHTYMVDGDITISDICVAANCNSATASDWRTVLIGSLNSGGRGYYALDITDTTNPKLLWEFDASSVAGNHDKNLGYTFGNPIVTKRSSDNKWVVIFTSGYNNIPDNDGFYSLSTTKFKPNTAGSPTFNTGDGHGYLYVVDAATGNKLAAIDTGVNTTSDPSGLAKIKAYADDAEKNNVTQFAYGGDLLGNLWRFDISNNTVSKIAELKAGSKAQPITTSPELGIVSNKKVVFVGTGKYLEVSDLTNTDQQTLYAIKDSGPSAATLVNPRSGSVLVKQTIGPDPLNADQRISTSSNAVDFTSGNGWYVDLPDSGERENVASRLVLGTLIVPTTVPTSTACQPAGYGWFNYLDYKTGRSVTTTPASNVVAQRTTAPSVGFNVVYVGGKPKVSNVVANDRNPKLVDKVPFSGSGTGFQTKRSIWREITE